MSVVKVRYCSKLQRDICLWYEGFGNPADPPVLLIMGLNGQGIAWDDEFCQMLAAKGPFYVIRFDNRDVGLSTKIENVTQPWMVLLALPEWAAYYLGEKLPYTLEDMADDAVALLDTLNIPKAHIVGHSMGGMIAQLIAIHHPDRCLSLISMCSSTGGKGLPPSPPFWAKLKFLKRPKSTSLEDRADALAGYFRSVSCYGAPIDEDYLKAFASRSVNRMVYPQGLARHSAAVTRQKDRDEALRSVTLPTLIIHGVHDHLIPLAHGERAAAVMPHAKFVKIDDMAHFRFPRHRDRLATEISTFISAAS